MKFTRSLKQAARTAGFEIRLLPRVTAIPDAELYEPFYAPWRSPAFAAPYAVASQERCHVLATLAAQAARLDGEVWERSVYRGGTAMLLAERLVGAGRTLRLFDTFAGMPLTDAAKDLHSAAVDDFFRGTGSIPLALPTGQAIVFKSLA